MEPRVVIVSRQTEYERMIARYGTASQSSYVVANSFNYLESVTNSNDDYMEDFFDGSNELVAVAGAKKPSSIAYAGAKRVVRSKLPSRTQRSSSSNVDSKSKALHDRYHKAINTVTTAIPETWRQARITRDLLDRFNFESDDIVVVIGQDGLVANVASYLELGQPVIGFNHAPDLYPGVLCTWSPESDIAKTAFRMAQARDNVSLRTMVEASLDNEQRVVCLNEIYVGHHSHQSSRYAIWSDSNEEDQSSSGVIISTGTGATGWASSIYRGLDEAYRCRVRVPNPDEDALAFFVREPWESPGTRANIRCGNIGTNINNSRSSQLVLTSHMEEGGVIFGDGIESDFIEFSYGRVASILQAEQKLHLIVKD